MVIILSLLGKIKDVKYVILFFLGLIFVYLFRRTLEKHSQENYLKERRKKRKSRIKLNREIMEEVLLTSYIQTCQSLSLQGVSQILKLSWQD
jgi:uncharacterized ion transporter superfamily protein YfcC